MTHEEKRSVKISEDLMGDLNKLQAALKDEDVRTKITRVVQRVAEGKIITSFFSGALSNIVGQRASHAVVFVVSTNDLKMVDGLKEGGVDNKTVDFLRTLVRDYGDALDGVETAMAHPHNWKAVSPDSWYDLDMNSSIMSFDILRADGQIVNLEGPVSGFFQLAAIILHSIESALEKTSKKRLKEKTDEEELVRLEKSIESIRALARRNIGHVNAVKSPKIPRKAS